MSRSTLRRSGGYQPEKQDSVTFTHALVLDRQHKEMDTGRDRSRDTKEGHGRDTAGTETGTSAGPRPGTPVYEAGTPAGTPASTPRGHQKGGYTCHVSGAPPRQCAQLRMHVMHDTNKEHDFPAQGFHRGPTPPDLRPIKWGQDGNLHCPSRCLQPTGDHPCPREGLRLHAFCCFLGMFTISGFWTVA